MIEANSTCAPEDKTKFITLTGAGIALSEIEIERKVKRKNQIEVDLASKLQTVQEEIYLIKCIAGVFLTCLAAAFE